MEIPFAIILLVLFCALLGATGQIFFKLASAEFSFNPLTWLKNGWFIGGIALYAVAAVLLVWALKHGNVSVIYPIVATTYIWTALFAKFFLHESIPAIRWLGVGLIVLGIMLVVK